MKDQRGKTWIAILCLLALLLLSAARADAVTLTLGTGTGIAGQTVDLDVTSDDLTGLGVGSYQFTVSYYSYYVTAVDVLEPNTLTSDAGWAVPEFHVTDGKISVSAAGTTPLSGTGVLIRLRFLLLPYGFNGGYSSLDFQSILLNEGTPSATGVSGHITVNRTPTIRIWPDTGEIASGETLQFSVSGDVTPPYSWGTTDLGVATMAPSGNNGILTGVAPGSVRAFVVDQAGLRDSTDNLILVRGMRVTVGSASAAGGTQVSIPLTVTDLTGLGARAGQFTVAFDTTYVKFISATPGAMLAGYQFSAAPHPGPGYANAVTVSFAGSDAVAGAGELCSLRFLAGTRYTGWPTLTCSEATFNETLPAARTDGSIQVTSPGSITVYPTSCTMLVGQTQQFTPYGTYTLPLTWTTADPNVATIDPNALLTAQSGGVTRVRAQDANGVTGENTLVDVYDFQLDIPPVISAVPGMKIHVPISADRDLGDLDIRSLQCTLVSSDTSLAQAQADSAGLVAVWGRPTGHAEPRVFSISAAGIDPLAHAVGVPVATVEYTVSSQALTGQNFYLTFSSVLFNEGHPRALAGNGGRVLIVYPIADFNLLAPGSGTQWFNDEPPTLTWQEALMNDPNSPLDHYSVEWSKDSNFPPGQTNYRRVSPDSTIYEFPQQLQDLGNPSTIYWRVRAANTRGDSLLCQPNAGWYFFMRGVTPVGLTVSATPSDEGILVSWVVPGGIEGIGYRVYRRTQLSEWAAISPILPAGEGTLQYLDTAVEPGIVYEYQVELLGASGPAGRWGGGTAELKLPTTLWLRVGPNPGRGSLTATFGLPHAGRVTLRLFDASGRAIARRDLPAMAAGRHQVAWTPWDGTGAGPASGAYWVRLDSGSLGRTTGWVVIR